MNSPAASGGGVCQSLAGSHCKAWIFSIQETVFQITIKA